MLLHLNVVLDDDPRRQGLLHSHNTAAAAAAMGDDATNNASLQTSLDTLVKSIQTLQSTVEANSQAIRRLETATSGSSVSSGPRSGSGEHHQDRPPKHYRMDFPRYDGKSDPLIFINRCNSFFH